MAWATIRFGFAVSLLSTLGACGGNVVVDTANGGTAGAGGTGGTAGAGAAGTGGIGGTTSSSSSTSDTGTSTFTTGTTGTSTSTSSGASCPSSLPSAGPCSPGISCVTAASPCLAVVPQNGAPVFGLRMSEVDFIKPQAFTSGVVSTVVEAAATPNEPGCNLQGTGTFSWLLQYDTQKGVVTTGGARPAASAGGPYTFANETVMGVGAAITIAPVVLQAPFASCAIDAQGGDLNLPIYLDAMGANAVVLPLRQLQLYKGFVSDDNSCIGTYNASALDPANACQPQAGEPQFVNGGLAGGYIVLSEADTIPIPMLGQTLCVLLSGNTATYGEQEGGLTVCKKGPNHQILFQGDWCAATNAPASATCADSMQFVASFAASGVTIN